MMKLHSYVLQQVKRGLRRIHDGYFLKTLKHRAKTFPRNRPGELHFKGLKVQYTDIPSFYTEYKDIFLNHIYHFDSTTPTPLIIDGGAGIGMATLYFKMVYPKATVVSFEPDENIFKILHNNITVNGLTDIKLIRAGLAGFTGKVNFLSDGADGGRIVNVRENKCTIDTVVLSEYLDSPVDFLKLNIEGQELPVLLEAEGKGKLHNVRELVLEYHGWPNDDQRLGTLLNLLDRSGFRYLVHDFDPETCWASKPPFRWTPQTLWFCLVYARQPEKTWLNQTGK